MYLSLCSTTGITFRINSTWTNLLNNTFYNSSIVDFVLFFHTIMHNIMRFMSWKGRYRCTYKDITDLLFPRIVKHRQAIVYLVKFFFKWYARILLAFYCLCLHYTNERQAWRWLCISQKGPLYICRYPVNKSSEQF